MKKLLALSAIALSFAIADVAAAHGNVSCGVVARADRKPAVELQKLLKSQGWKIRKIQIYNGCYEVYGFDEKERPVEAFFHPKTLERVPTN